MARGALAGTFLVDYKYERVSTPQESQHAQDIYLANLDYVNNWDLVDASAHKLIGPALIGRSKALLYELADSGELWRERIGVVACYYFIKHDQFEDIICLAAKFLHHEHDLMHKAVGWMLRLKAK